jgi:hypothetical protein
MWPGAEDEPPEGPNGFDVFDDGSIVISDPLRARVVVFDPDGRFHQSWNVGFAADSIRILPEGVVLIRGAKTGELHRFDREGRLIAGVDSTSSPEPLQGHKLTSTSGSIPVPGGKGNAIAIQLDRPGISLLSIEPLSADHDGNTYVAVETTGGELTDAINVSKTVRKYSPGGSLLCETADLPLDYYIAPEVRINVWDTN